MKNFILQFYFHFFSSLFTIFYFFILIFFRFMDRNIVPRLLVFARQFFKTIIFRVDAEIQCQVQGMRDAKYRIQEAILGNICGNTGTDRFPPFKMKFNTHYSLRSPYFAFPLYHTSLNKAYLLNVLCSFICVTTYIYLSMRNQLLHFSRFKTDKFLQAFLLRGNSSNIHDTYNLSDTRELLFGIL